MKQLIIYNNILYKLEIWDTIGAVGGIHFTKLFFRDSNMTFIFYGYQHKDSFELAKFLIDYTKRECINKNCIYVLVCNKYDLNLESGDIVPDEEAIEIAEKNNLIFTHLSLFEKYSNGVNELLKKALNEYIISNNTPK